jgi:hypothetical protein
MGWNEINPSLNILKCRTKSDHLIPQSNHNCCCWWFISFRCFLQTIGFGKCYWQNQAYDFFRVFDDVLKKLCFITSGRIWSFKNINLPKCSVHAKVFVRRHKLRETSFVDDRWPFIQWAGRTRLSTFVHNESSSVNLFSVVTIICQSYWPVICQFSMTWTWGLWRRKGESLQVGFCRLSQKSFRYPGISAYCKDSGFWS